MSEQRDQAAIKKGMLAVIFAAFIGGGIPVMGKIALTVVPPTIFTFLRFFIASLCMLPFIFPLPKLSKRVLMKILGISLFATANVALFPFGIKFTTATIGQLLYAAVPIVILVLARQFFGEKITQKKVIGVGVGLLGVVILVLMPLFSKGSLYAGTLYGNSIIFTGVIVFSLYSLFSKKYQRYVTPAQLTFIFAVMTTILMFPFALREHLLNPVWMTHVNIGPILSILYVGIIGGAAYYLTYQFAIKHGGPVIASLTLFLQPLATYMWALALLGEKLLPGVIFGALLTILGAKIVTHQEKN